LIHKSHRKIEEVKVDEEVSCFSYPNLFEEYTENFKHKIQEKTYNQVLMKSKCVGY